jgi:peptidoglycan/xylan/chitin deacetylase (PgdA/CDA1 family)
MALNKGKYKILDLANLKHEKIACLTLDLEQDYGDILAQPSYEGIKHTRELVSYFQEKNIPLTCFVQGSLLETHPDQIEQWCKLDADFELHSYSHQSPKERHIEAEVERGKKAYLNFFNREPLGYRAPLGVISEADYELLARHGFKFDSSIFPSFRPGAFNNLRMPTVPYFLPSSGIAEFPITVFSSFIRIPISLSYVKLLGKPYFYLLRSIKLPDLIIFCFHLHDLYTLSSSKNIPFKKFSPLYRTVFRRIYTGRSNNGIGLLQNFVNLFSNKGYRFLKLIDIYRLTTGESPS